MKCTNHTVEMVTMVLNKKTFTSMIAQPHGVNSKSKIFENFYETVMNDAMTIVAILYNRLIHFALPIVMFQTATCSKISSIN